MSLFIVGHEPGVLGELVLWVPGKAQTAGSKSAFVNPKTGKAIVTESGSERVEGAQADVARRPEGCRRARAPRAVGSRRADGRGARGAVRVRPFAAVGPYADGP
jgi:hypothetical protein